MAARLDELVRRLGGSLEPEGSPARRPASAPGAGATFARGGPEVRDVALDSRRVRCGDLFVAVPGARDDGLRHVPEALSRGAVAVLTPPGAALFPARAAVPGLEVAHWVHPDPLRACARAAAIVHGDPARGLVLAAVTGTNGKTTTVHVLGHLLRRAGLEPAVLGTAGHRLAGNQHLGASHTTPDAPELARLLRRHADAGGRSLAMEVSSHALEQQRTAGLDFDVAVFTNLTREHLDYHGDMHRYARAKARLFEGLRPGAAAVINVDDPAWRTMSAAAEGARARVVTYSTRHEADLRASRPSTDPAGTRFELDGMGIFSTDLRLPLRGRYNVENALAAAAAARLMGASPSEILEGLATTSSAPGRLEPIPSGARGFAVFVDYAHSPDALERVLVTARELVAGHGATGRLIVVFGCGGDRDRGKRAPMGRAAAELADVAVVTSDNPRGEDPAAIADAVLAGFSEHERAGARGAEVRVELDRRRAIALALSLARSGDVVLVAGKGHEATQEIGGERLPFDDRAVVREVLETQEVAA